MCDTIYTICLISICEGRENWSVPSPPSEKESKAVGKRKEEAESCKEPETVKTEVCLSEEGNNGEEQWMEVWEENLNRGGEALDFQAKEEAKEEEKAREPTEVVIDTPLLHVNKSSVSEVKTSAFPAYPGQPPDFFRPFDTISTDYNRLQTKHSHFRNPLKMLLLKDYFYMHDKA